MPVIFASVIFTIPTFIAGLMDSESAFAVFVSKYVKYTTPIGFIAYMLIIILFCFFYTFLQINPEELSKNLNRQGGYIPGVRPGKETKEYISTVIGRITFIGALSIALIAGIPIVFSSFINTGLPTSVSIGGTGILIVIGVALETYNQLESSLLNRNYKGVR
jgi:preprotein translocase subunit SecY